MHVATFYNSRFEKLGLACGAVASRHPASHGAAPSRLSAPWGAAPAKRLAPWGGLLPSGTPHPGWPAPPNPCTWGLRLKPLQWLRSLMIVFHPSVFIVNH